MSVVHVGVLVSGCLLWLCLHRLALALGALDHPLAVDIDGCDLHQSNVYEREIMTKDHSALALIEFPEANQVIARNQPQYRPLPAHRRPDHPQGEIVCCWRLTWRQRLRLLFTGRIWHSIWTFDQSLQPQRLEIEKPLMTTKGK